MVALVGDKEIGEKINKIIAGLAEANELGGSSTLPTSTMRTSSARGRRWSIDSPTSSRSSTIPHWTFVATGLTEMTCSVVAYNSKTPSRIERLSWPPPPASDFLQYPVKQNFKQTPAPGITQEAKTRDHDEEHHPTRSHRRNTPPLYCPGRTDRRRRTGHASPPVRDRHHPPEKKPRPATTPATSRPSPSTSLGNTLPPPLPVRDS